MKKLIICLSLALMGCGNAKDDLNNLPKPLIVIKSEGSEWISWTFVVKDLKGKRYNLSDEGFTYKLVEMYSIGDTIK